MNLHYAKFWKHCTFGSDSLTSVVAGYSWATNYMLIVRVNEKMKKVVLKIIVGASIATPYISTVLLLRTSSIFNILVIDFVALISLIFFTAWLNKTTELKRNRIINSLLSVIAVLVFFLTYFWQATLSDIVFFKMRESTLTEMVKKITTYGKISEMSDGQRYWKTLNNEAYGTKRPLTEWQEDADNIVPLGEVLNKYNIDPEIFNEFKETLIEVDLISFINLDDGTISFTIDGMLDNCSGLAYSSTGIAPDHNDCGDIISWIRIGENWYSWGST